MSALLSTLIAQFWPYIIGALGLLFAAWRVRTSGRDAEKARQAAAEAKARDVADQVDNDVGTIPPAEARKELGRWSKS